MFDPPRLWEVTSPERPESDLSRPEGGHELLKALAEDRVLECDGESAPQILKTGPWSSEASIYTVDFSPTRCPTQSLPIRCDHPPSSNDRSSGNQLVSRIRMKPVESVQGSCQYCDLGGDRNLMNSPAQQISKPHRRCSSEIDFASPMKTSRFQHGHGREPHGTSIRSLVNHNPGLGTESRAALRQPQQRICIQ